MLKIVFVLTFIIQARRVDLSNAINTQFNAYPKVTYSSESSSPQSLKLNTRESFLLYFVGSQEDIQKIKLGSLHYISKNGKFAIFLNGTYFNKANILLLSESQGVGCIIIGDDVSRREKDYRPPPYSTDANLRPGDSHYKSGYQWNPDGDDILNAQFKNKF
ncbi:MAG: hypothetical protein EZS28_028443 [Streblomastix strix]|uniref:Nicastrin small lobe domain-containing protein n=1 Tax=Streblomastix strix TaxID=222440 RepID=A0A5J4V1U5_9EUKA|nr:MAG: hypothetical protein EZS28_028443 [Streblomastix strix]